MGVGVEKRVRCATEERKERRGGGGGGFQKQARWGIGKGLVLIYSSLSSDSYLRVLKYGFPTSMAPLNDLPMCALKVFR